MKHTNIFLLLYMATLAVKAQQNNPQDSVRTVVLSEVEVVAKQKGTQLQSFFNANKSATTEDLLARLPELSLIRRGSYGMEPVIRSFSSSQTSLLLDGMRIHGACTDKMDPASIYIEPQNLQSIEVKTNGSSLLNATSIGGTINMKLAEASCHESKKITGSLSSGYQSASKAVNQSLNITYATPKLALRASGTYRKSNNYKDGSGSIVPFSQYEKVNYSINGKCMLRENVYLKADFLADDGWNIGYPALPMDVGYANARIGAISIVKENKTKPWQKLEAKLYANKIKHYMDDTHRPNVPMHMDMPGQSATSGFYTEATRRLANKHLITLRADASVTKLKASMTMYEAGQPPMYMLTWPDNRQIQGGIAAHYLWNIDSSTQLQVSVRNDISEFSLTSETGKNQLAIFNYDKTDKNFFTPATSLQLTRKLFSKLKAILSLSLNGRTPTASELYGFYLFNQFDGYDYVGNPTLKQEIGRQAELTLLWQQPKARLQLTGYISHINNYILGTYNPPLSAMTIGAKGVKTYTNTEYARLAGGEASLIYTALPNMQIISTLKYAYGQDAHKQPLPMIAPLRNISSVRYTHKQFWLQPEFEAAAAQNRINEAAKEQPTGDFCLWHIRTGYQLNTKRLTWQLNTGVENLMNAWYREHLDWSNIARPGRNFYLQVTAGF